MSIFWYASMERFFASSYAIFFVSHSAGLPWAILSSGRTEERGYGFLYGGIKRSVARPSDGFKIFDVEKDTNNVLCQGIHYTVYLVPQLPSLSYHEPLTV